ncbi:MAG: (5-formylfuran-3-yl)methyl phosphate synthase [Methylophilaceae bacterium]
MTKLLASVTNVSEALLAVDAGVDIIDLKNPAQGALGALSLSEIGEIARAIDGCKLISATIGDLPMEPELLIRATEHTAATGVDIVKVGFFGLASHGACIKALQPLAAKGVRIVAVLFADQNPDFALLPELQMAGFYGVMLDTVQKNGSSLLDYVLVNDLQQFVKLARTYKLESGLAGSLRLNHVPGLVALSPGYLGFRGALCANSERTAALSSNKIHELQAMLRKCNMEVADMM